jgi:threonine aldolase
MPPVDLRSDTVTRPSAAMREAMADAPVGDDVYGEDPTVNELERRAAEMTGKEAALFVPSGTMGNQLGIRCWAGQADEVIVHAQSHLLNEEGGGMSALWGIQPRAIDGPRGTLDLEAVEAALQADVDDPHLPPPRAVCVENTHMRAGGRVYPAEDLQELADLAHAAGVAIHMDGARMPNAAVASGRTMADVCAPADTVQFCLSKGLGAPVGSILAGSAAAIAQARRRRKLLGGGMRQAGILAAAGLYALEHGLERLSEDHARAKRLAEGLAGLGRVEVDPAMVETNIVLARLRGPGDSSRVAVADLAAAGVLANELGDGRTVRFVTHLDVGDEAVHEALARAREPLGTLVDCAI